MYKSLPENINTHLLWIIGSTDDHTFQQTRTKVSNLPEDQVFQFISVSIDHPIDPLCDRETCICINDEATTQNLIHDMTCLWSLPQMACIDLYTFREILGGKRCGLKTYSVSKDGGLAELQTKAEGVGRSLSNFQSIFSLVAFDQSACDYIISGLEAILEPIYKNSRYNEDDLIVGQGDTGWPGCLEVECFMRVTVFYKMPSEL